MKIFFSKKQFAKLIRLAYLGEWMVNANRVGDEKLKEYEDVYLYVLSFAKVFGLEKLIQPGKHISGVVESRYFEMEDEVNEFRKEYEEEVFRDELRHRLALRDYYRTTTKEQHEAMSREEFFGKMVQCEERREKEFEEYGLNRL